MERRKPGRPWKGHRRLANFKLPVPLLDAVKEHAAQRGITVTDLVGGLLAAEVGMTYPCYTTQEGLPLDKAS